MDCLKKTPRQLKLVFREKLGTLYNENEATQICYRLFNDFLGWSPARIQMNQDLILEDQICVRFEDALHKLIDSVPVQYIVGHTEFVGLKLYVAPGVLIPRPETEELATRIIREEIFKSEHPIRVLDIGTGSGCLALAIKQAFPRTTVLGIDSSPEALEIAGKNAGTTRLEVTFKQFDFLDRTRWNRLPCFDVIISNPPYVLITDQSGMHPNVVGNEPHEALFVPADDPLLFFKAIAGFASSHLCRPGLIYTEINEQFGKAITDLFYKAGFTDIGLIQDMYGKDRYIKVES